VSAAAPDPDPWDDPPQAAVPGGDAPVLAVDGFEGPLPWLLELARAQRIDLRRLSILQLVEAFGRALEAALRQGGRADLARWAEWLVMAAQLAWLRSRLLLPPDDPAAKSARAEADALRSQLLEADAMRRAARWLEARPQIGREVFGRGAEAADRPTPSGRAADNADLFQACLLVLRVPETAGPYAPALPPLWRVPDALARITRLLQERPAGGALRAFLPRLPGQGPQYDLRCRAALASTFLAFASLSAEAAGPGTAIRSALPRRTRQHVPGRA
jgi:segregation and condensation protein A